MVSLCSGCQSALNYGAEGCGSQPVSRFTASDPHPLLIRNANDNRDETNFVVSCCVRLPEQISKERLCPRKIEMFHINYVANCFIC